MQQPSPNAPLSSAAAADDDEESTSPRLVALRPAGTDAAARFEDAGGRGGPPLLGPFLRCVVTTRKRKNRANGVGGVGGGCPLVVVLRRPDATSNESSCLRVGKGGKKANMNGSGGAFARFVVESCEEEGEETTKNDDERGGEGEGGGVVRFVCERNGLALAIDGRTGDLIGVPATEPDPSGRTRFRIVDLGRPTSSESEPVEFGGLSLNGRRRNSAAAASAAFDESATLTDGQLASFARDGYLVLRNVVPLASIAEARRVVNAHLLRPGSVTVDPDDDDKILVCPELKRSETLLSLLHETSLWTYVQRLLGRGKAKKVGGCQIALRPPKLRPPFRVELGGASPSTSSSSSRPISAEKDLNEDQWHFDGMGSVKGGFDHSPFTLLAGVALSPQKVPFTGNLAVFPGSHRVIHPLVCGAASSAGASAPSLWSASPHGGSKPDLGTKPIHVLLEPGDVVLCHQKTAHRIGPNYSPDVRYNFWVGHVRRKERRVDGTLLSPDELFAEYDDAVRDVAPPP